MSSVSTSSDFENKPWYKLIFTKKMLICIFTGFSSGLPLFFIIQLLPAWLLSYGLTVKAIAAFSLVQLPYVLKFLWAPLLDRFALVPLLGRRRSWIFLMSLLLCVAIALYGLIDPKWTVTTPRLPWMDVHMSARWWQVFSWFSDFSITFGLREWTVPVFVLLSLGVTFFSSTLDVALDAFRREILSDKELGLGNSIHVNAYKIAGFVPGALSLILADHYAWPTVFFFTALFMLPGVMLALLVKEPEASKAAPRTLKSSVVEPFKEFFMRQGWKMALFILAFMLLYKLGDSMATALQSTFVLKMGFSKTDLGTINKGIGLISSIIGGIVAGIWMLRLGINKALWVFGVIQALAILAFAVLAHYGPFTQIGPFERTLLAVVIASETFGMSLGTMAFVAFIARTTNPAYTALQLALFTSLTAVPRSFINASTGWLVERMGWESFFYLCMLLAIPGMLMLFKIAPWHEENRVN